MTVWFNSTTPENSCLMTDNPNMPLPADSFLVEFDLKGIEI